MFEKELLQITQEVWQSVVKITLHTVDASPDDVIKKDHLAGIVRISGAWNGIVVLRCPRELVDSILTSIIGEALGNYDDVSLSDTLGELTNIIGGNLKAMLPTPCQLALPIVMDGHQHNTYLHNPDNDLVCQVLFECKHSLMLAEIYTMATNDSNV